MRRLTTIALATSILAGGAAIAAPSTATTGRPIILSSKSCITQGRYLSTTYPGVALAWGMLLRGKLTSEQFIAVWHRFVDANDEGAIDTGNIREFVSACAGVTL